MRKPKKRVASNGKATGGITGKGFMPGQSGNPTGRPKSDPEFVEACRERTPKALATLDAAMRDVENNPGPATKAAEILLNRAWGTAPSTINLNANVTADVRHDVKAEVIQSPERMRTIVAVLRRAGQLEENTETAAPVETKVEST